MVDSVKDHIEIKKRREEKPLELTLCVCARAHMCGYTYVLTSVWKDLQCYSVLGTMPYALKVLFHFISLLMKVEECTRVVGIEDRVLEVKEMASRWIQAVIAEKISDTKKEIEC